MQNLIYVLASDGTPLMPTKRVGRVRHYLKNKEAIIVNYKPFTIKFIKDTNKYTQDITLGIDPGRTNIGLARINNNGKCLYSALVESNNKQVTKHMSERKTHRQTSRRGERLRRQRRAIKNNTIISSIKKERILPGCEKPIIVKYIKNSKAKFNNRKRSNEWLNPTVNISFTQKNTCLLCKHKVEHYHHIIPKSKGGSDTHKNIAGLCNKCHDKVHKDSKYEIKLKSLKEGLLKKYSGSAIINTAMPYIIKELNNLGLKVRTTYGYETKATRDKYLIPKYHDYDAYSIALKYLNLTSLKVPVLDSFSIKQYRRHNRAKIYAQRERTYKLDGIVVAKNRNKRTEQKTISLKEFRREFLHTYGRTKYNKMLGKLKVTKSTRRYKQKRDLSEGCVALYNKKRFVVTGSSGAGKYIRLLGLGTKDINIKNCKLLKKNEGLVYL